VMANYFTGANGGGIHLPVMDAMGNVTQVVRAGVQLNYNGDSMRSEFVYDYDAFGKETRSSTLVAGLNPDSFPFHYSTKFTDPESGFNYYGYRFYDPANGRWPSRDPIGERGGVNLYGMVGNDAVNRMDVLGLTACDDYVNKLADHLDEPGGRNKLSDDLVNGRYPNGRGVDGFKDRYTKSGQGTDVYRHLDRGIGSGLSTGFQVFAQTQRDRVERGYENTFGDPTEAGEKDAEVNADQAARKASALIEEAFRKLLPEKRGTCRTPAEKEKALKELKEKLKNLLCN
jgi:RHS repeat-associated protein